MPQVASSSATIITAKTRFHSSRRAPSISRADDAVHARAVGEVLHAWNRAHAALFMVFARIATDNDFGLALALWQTKSGDRAQREMLAAVAANSLAQRKSYLNALKWALAAMKEIGDYRNDVAHSEMVYYYTELIPGMTVREVTAERLTQRRLDKNWRAVRGDLHALTNYLGHIQFSLGMKMPRPLSRRPKLRFVRSSSARGQETRRKAKRLARERQRQSSRP